MFVVCLCVGFVAPSLLLEVGFGRELAVPIWRHPPFCSITNHYLRDMFWTNNEDSQVIYNIKLTVNYIKTACTLLKISYAFLCDYYSTRKLFFGGWKRLKIGAVFHCNSGSAQLSAHWSLTNAEVPPSWISRFLGMLGKEKRFEMAACLSFFFLTIFFSLCYLTLLHS